MFWKYNLFPLLWCLVILLFNMMPGHSMPETDIWTLLEFDTLAHFFIFTVLVLMLIVGLSKQYKYLYLRYHALRVAVVFSLTYGLLIELGQWMVPERTFEYWDLIANGLGCGVGVATFWLIYRL